ncbi:MAG: helix-turn-helix domain-containing protein [Flammeovirgaceae bacterium]|nr:helix-turn-helix domain-containing protein [Flammeovirgaceae bacterium]
MIYLLYKGFSRKACAQILDCSPATVTSVIRLYNEGGLAQLRQVNYYRPVSSLLPFQNQIETAVSDMLPGSIRELREWILEHTGLDRSVRVSGFFLKH